MRAQQNDDDCGRTGVDCCSTSAWHEHVLRPRRMIRACGNACGHAAHTEDVAAPHMQPPRGTRTGTSHPSAPSCRPPPGPHSVLLEGVSSSSLEGDKSNSESSSSSGTVERAAARSFGVPLSVEPAKKGAESSVHDEEGVMAELPPREARDRGVPGSEALGSDGALIDDRTHVQLSGAGAVNDGEPGRSDCSSDASASGRCGPSEGSCASAAGAGCASSGSGGGPEVRGTPSACTWSSAAADSRESCPSAAPAATSGPHQGGGAGTGWVAARAKMEGGVPRGARATISDRRASAAAETGARREWKAATTRGANVSNWAGATSCGANCRRSACSIHSSATSRVALPGPPARSSFHGDSAASHDDSSSSAKSQLSCDEKASAKAPKKRSAKARAKAPATSATSASPLGSPPELRVGPIAARSSRATARGRMVDRNRSSRRSASADPHRSRKAAARGAASAAPIINASVCEKSTAITSRLFGGIRSE
eukprot:scaffold1889_cov108-Isochrysis_galbana.AAC.2